MAGPVTDPALLAQLDAPGKVSDPALLSQLEGHAAPEPTWTDKIGTGVNEFFGRGDPKHPKEFQPQDLVKQGLKAGAFLVPGSGLLPMATSGALYGAGASDAQDATGMLKDSALGAAGGLALGAGGKLIGNAIQSPVRAGISLRASLPGLVPQAVQQTAAIPGEVAVPKVIQWLTGSVAAGDSANQLMQQGVRLTRGQQAPLSPANQLEQALQSTHPYGPAITNQRATGLADLQIAALNHARPPGVPPIKIGSEFEAGMGSLSEGFNKAYQAIGDHPIYPAVHGVGGGPLQTTGSFMQGHMGVHFHGQGESGLVEKAVDGIKRLSPNQSASIKADVLDLLGKLPERKGAVGKIGAGDLMDVRSIIRSRARELMADHSAESSAAAEAYGAVEDVLTKSLKSQLPKDATKALDATDAAYRNFKILDTATRAARASPEGFTPRQLAMAASSGSSGAQIGRGDVNPLYDLALSGADVFRRTSQPTGERLVTLQTASKYLPSWAVNRAAGHAIAAGNNAAMSPVRPSLPPGLALPGPMGAAPGPSQSAAEMLIDALRRSGRPRLMSAGAQDEGTPK
jgi:hypothetical protein